MLVFFTNLSFRQAFGLILSLLSNRRLRVILDGKPSQEYPVNTGVRQRPILGAILFILCIIMILSVILLSMMMILLSTLSVIRHLTCGNN